MNDYVTEAELLALGVDRYSAAVSPPFTMPIWNGRNTKNQTIDLMITPGQRQDPIHLNNRVFEALCQAGMEQQEVELVLAKAQAARILEIVPGHTTSTCVNVVMGLMSHVLKNVQLKRLKRANTAEVANLTTHLNDALNRIQELEAQVKMDADERHFTALMEAIGDDTNCMKDVADLMCDERPLSPSPSSSPPPSPPLTHAQAISLAFAQEMFTDGYFN